MSDEQSSSLSIEDYLAQIARGRKSAFGQRFRKQFQDQVGDSELSMLTAPNEKEFSALSKIVAIMSRFEKMHIDALDEKQIKEIADTAEVDLGTTQIFINGYILACRQNKR